MVSLYSYNDEGKRLIGLSVSSDAIVRLNVTAQTTGCFNHYLFNNSGFMLKSGEYDVKPMSQPFCISCDDDVIEGIYEDNGDSDTEAPTSQKIHERHAPLSACTDWDDDWGEQGYFRLKH